MRVRAGVRAYICIYGDQDTRVQCYPAQTFLCLRIQLCVCNVQILIHCSVSSEVVLNQDKKIIVMSLL